MRRLQSAPAGGGEEEAERDPDIGRLETRLADLIGSEVSIRHGKRGSERLVIRYHCLDALGGILERLDPDHGAEESTGHGRARVRVPQAYTKGPNAPKCLGRPSRRSSRPIPFRPNRRVGTEVCEPLMARKEECGKCGCIQEGGWYRRGDRVRPRGSVAAGGAGLR